MEKIKLVKFVKIKYAIIKAKRFIKDVWWAIVSYVFMVLIVLRIIRQK